MSTPSATPTRRGLWGGLLPGVPAWVVIALCVGLIAYFRHDAEDRGFANLYTLIFGFIALVTVAMWFYLFSAYRRRTCVLATLLVLVVAGAALACVRVEWYGGMRPKFSWRWSRAPGEGLAPKVAEQSEGVDLTTTSEQDFPGFLGPQRDAYLPGPELARDWEARPPKLVWRREIGAGWAPFSAVNGYALTLEQINEEEVVTCYDIATGDLVWMNGVKARHDNALGGLGPRSAVTIDEGRVYALGATGIFRCLDGATGEELWRHDLPEEFGVAPGEDTQAITWGRSASPLVVGDLVVVPAGGPVQGPHVSLVAYDKHDGSEVWRGGDMQIGYSSPSLETLGGLEQILLVCESQVAGFDPADGHVLWQFEKYGTSNAAPNASQARVLEGGRVFTSKGYSLGASVWDVATDDDRFEPRLVWDRETLGRSVLKTKLANVVIHDGYAYGLDDGILQCVDLESGKSQWKTGRGRFGDGQILGVGELLLVITDDGEVKLLELNPEKLVILGEFQAIEGKTWNNLCLYGPYLLVRNGLEAACYKLPLAE